MEAKYRKSGRMGKGIYLLPNLLTTASIFAGFYAIVASMKGHFELAAVAVFVAMIMDGLDGRVARLTNTQSAFGAEFDSLSDMVSFGIAPALIAYNWALHDMGNFGWLAAFVYTICAALRLARFNTQVESADKRYFQGLASPSAAANIAGLVWISNAYALEPTTMAIPTIIFTILSGILMVSNFRYYSFKVISWKDKVPFIGLLLVVVVIVTIAYDPPVVLFTVFLAYAISGPVHTLWLLREVKTVRKSAPSRQNTDE
ncbi:MAG: CDP-diacylglycerol--serine O-phosphatidyltransferase [Pseudomonadota bacterium]